MVENQNLTLGLGELYFKRKSDASGKYVRVGSLKGTVSFNYEVEYAEHKPGNSLCPVKRCKTAERATLTATVGDFKVSQLIAALGLSISTTQITATSTLRVVEELQMDVSTTTTQTLANTPVSATSIVVTSLNRGTTYTQGTHYTAVGNKIRHLTTTMNSDYFNVEYDYADASATRVIFGDDTVLQEVDLKFVHKIKSTGKFVQIEIPIATINGGLSIPFNETDFTMYDISFAALADMTKPEGQRLAKIIREA